MPHDINPRSGTGTTNKALSRRRLLRVVGAAGVSASTVAGISGATDTELPTQEDAAYDPSGMETRRVDVEDGDEVSDVIADVEEGEVLVFPEGEFQWTESVGVAADNWGVIGQPNDGTVFMVPEGSEPTGDGFPEKYVLRTGLGYSTTGEASDNVLLKNLTFDSTGRSNPGIRFGVRDRGHVENLHYRCNGTIGQLPHTNGMAVYAQNPSGRITIKNYLQHNNGRISDYGGARSGMWVGGGNEGTVSIINPVLTGFINAFYVSRTPGSVNILGGYLANNNVSCVRLSDAGTVRGTTMVLDTEAYADGPGETTGGCCYNTRMVWADAGGPGQSGGLVQNCTFILESYDHSHGVVVNRGLGNSHIEVRESQFLLDDDLTGVAADDGEIELTNNTFDGAAATTAGAGQITGRNNCVTGELSPGAVPTNPRECKFQRNQAHPLARSND